MQVRTLWFSVVLLSVTVASVSSFQACSAPGPAPESKAAQDPGNGGGGCHVTAPVGKSGNGVCKCLTSPFPIRGKWWDIAKPTVLTWVCVCHMAEHSQLHSLKKIKINQCVSQVTPRSPSVWGRDFCVHINYMRVLPKEYDLNSLSHPQTIFFKSLSCF